MKKSRLFSAEGIGSGMQSGSIPLGMVKIGPSTLPVERIDSATCSLEQMRMARWRRNG
jgi:hypothetical protein